MGCKDLREVVDVQSDFARESFDRLMNEGSKLSEIGVKVANEALEPIQARVNVAVEKIFKPAAV
jgi:phasin family protein